jgi:hypothetical protein
MLYHIMSATEFTGGHILNSPLTDLKVQTVSSTPRGRSSPLDTALLGELEN